MAQRRYVSYKNVRLLPRLHVMTVVSMIAVVYLTPVEKMH